MTEKLTIEINSPLSMTLSNVDEGVRKALSFHSAWWRQGRYGKVREESTKTLIFHGTTFTGFLERLRSIHPDLVVQSHRIPKIPKVDPHLPRTTLADGNIFEDFRADQKVMLSAISQHTRGVIHGFTGVGKSILAMGTSQMFPSCRFLILCHTTGILDQIATDLDMFSVDEYEKLYSGRKLLTNKRIVLGTRQTVASMIEDGMIDQDYFQGVIVDECHHIKNLKGQYGTILRHFPAPIRIGFTATMPNPKTEAGLVIEGLIGPVISKLSVREGKELGLLAEPKICIRRVPTNWEIKKLQTFNEVQQAIANCPNRNTQIADDVALLVRENQKVLVLVVAVQHGANLQNLIRSRIDSPVLFMQGSVGSNSREQARMMLIRGETKCVISTVVWREGVNVRDLDVIVSAASQKDEIPVMQGIGRGLRRTSEKSEVLYIDYFDDSHRMLISHFGTRMSMFMDEGWAFMSIEEFLHRRKQQVPLTVKKRAS